MALTGYDKVADVIGDEMDKAWKNIMDRLSQGTVTGLTSGGVAIAQSELRDFFSKLGGAHMGLTFSCIEPKGEITRFNAHKLTPTGVSALVEGSISIGIGIKF